MYVQNTYTMRLQLPKYISLYLFILYKSRSVTSGSNLVLLFALLNLLFPFLTLLAPSRKLTAL